MIELLVSGVGATPDLAALEALKTAIRDQTQVLVQSKQVVANGHLFEDTIVTRSTGYITGYRVRDIRQEGGRYVVRVLAQVNEQKLEADLKATQGTVNGTMLAATAYRVPEPTPEPIDTLAERDRFESDPKIRASFPIQVLETKVAMVFERNADRLLELVEAKPRTLDIKTFCKLPRALEVVDRIRMLRVRFRDSLGQVVIDRKVKGSVANRETGIGWVGFVLPEDPEILTRLQKVEVTWD